MIVIDRLRIIYDTPLSEAERLEEFWRLYRENEVFKERMRAHGFIGTGYVAKAFDMADFAPPAPASHICA